MFGAVLGVRVQKGSDQGVLSENELWEGVDFLASREATPEPHMGVQPTG